jgi:DNA-binding beta-propeller fold protein YncE
MRAATVVILGCLLLSCAGQNSGRLGNDTKAPRKIPHELIFQNEISGRILGYNLQHPSGASVDPQGNLYITDTGNHRLIKFNRNLEPVRDYGGYGSGIGRFLNPEDMIIDRGLNLYVLDSGNRRVVHLDLNLDYVDEIVPEDAPDEIITTLGKLSGLQISSLGELTVADYDNSRLIRMDNFNNFSRYIGDFGYGQGALLSPMGIATNPYGRSFVADAGNGRIAVYDDFGNYLFQFGNSELGRPSAVTVSPYGIIWVADQVTQSVYAFSPQGKVLLNVGGPGRDDFKYSNIEALAASQDGKLYLADSGNNRIMIYRIVYEENG